MNTDQSLPTTQTKHSLTIDWEDVKPKSSSQGQLMFRRFRKHKLAVAGLVVLCLFYAVAVFNGFVATSDPAKRNSSYVYAPPTLPRFIDHEGNFHFRPFVYGLKSRIDPDTWERVYEIDHEKRHSLSLFVRGDKYRILGVFESDLHLFGTADGAPLFLLGTDSLGRDMYSRIVAGTSISLTIGLIGVFLSLVLGLLIGGLSGLVGGTTDLVIQRIIEILASIPQIPFWMALSATVPASWSPVQTYFAITIVLSLLSWTRVARVVRGKFLALREADFVMAAYAMGAGNWWVIIRHLIPNFLSYVLVTVTLTIPGMILGETSLSFLGIGLKPPAISWGILLQQAQNMRTIALRPWLLLPGVFVVIAVLAFNFVGDGLRDAADPYTSNRF
ncbi:MAG: ABC transporter permease [Firmicutes bacterium]|jgi:peptide/nickel transport system permease protein|nr:ABC transporter permease [Bacillota bacterium]